MEDVKKEKGEKEKKKGNRIKIACKLILLAI